MPWKLKASLFGPQSCCAHAQPSVGSAVVYVAFLALLIFFDWPDETSGFAHRQ